MVKFIKRLKEDLDIISKKIKDKSYILEFIKFTIVGFINTFSNYAFYLLFMNICLIQYKMSYILGYILSLVGSYFMNTYFTYKERFKIKTFLLFPLTYIPNFIIQFVGVILLVDYMSINDAIAPLITTVVAMPITFIVMMYVIKK